MLVCHSWNDLLSSFVYLTHFAYIDPPRWEPKLRGHAEATFIMHLTGWQSGWRSEKNCKKKKSGVEECRYLLYIFNFILCFDLVCVEITRKGQLHLNTRIGFTFVSNTCLMTVVITDKTRGPRPLLWFISNKSLLAVDKKFGNTRDTQMHKYTNDWFISHLHCIQYR